MKSLYEQFKTDEKVEKDGVWIEYALGTDAPPARIKVARAGGSNSKYNRIFEAKAKPYRRQLAAGTLDEKTSTRIYAEVYADSVVLAWENINGPDGKPMEFTRDNIIKLFTDLPELFDDVRAQASRIAAFRSQIATEEDSGN